jgi:Mg-chelatase subunit ChlD
MPDDEDTEGGFSESPDTEEGLSESPDTEEGLSESTDEGRKTEDGKGLMDSFAEIDVSQFASPRADVIFTFDCTGSMGVEIKAVQAAILDFADLFEKENIRLRLGLIEFRDRTIGEEIKHHSFSGEEFTQDAVAFKSAISGLEAMGGGPEPESSFDALMMACRAKWGDGQKVIVHITDAPPQTPDKDTKSVDEVISEFESVGIDQFYTLNHPSKPDHEVYRRLYEPACVSGMQFDLGGKSHDHLVKAIRNIGISTSMRTKKTHGRTE